MNHVLSPCILLPGFPSQQCHKEVTAMNPILQSLHTRKSVRAYDPYPIDAACTEAILRAATQAPSASNQQFTPFCTSPIPR